MQRITQLDAIDFAPRLPGWAVQALVAIMCILSAVFLRWLVDMVYPGAAPYAINVPAILLATLVGRFRAGLVVLVITSIYTWYEVVPFEGSFAFVEQSDGPRTVVNIVTGLLLVLLAEYGRRNVRELVHEREQRISERDMLLREVDHRVKNNLAILTSLLRLQQNETSSEIARKALEKAVGRVLSLANAYENLHYGIDNIAVVRFDQFIVQLCSEISNALALERKIDIRIETHPCHLSRDRASAIGLLINEVVTNAVKHAFTGREAGVISITLTSDDSEAVLTIEDDGVGLPEDVRDGAQGQGFLVAFAAMAKAELDCQSGSSGTRYTATLENLP
ncbi:sensor histidine kinase [Parasphingorhabdus sp.]|uniref:sensor histidine kinase n=1 Tax=Parasphingorhabdus sp. TaxID=2709688 RepID=UPI00300153B3